MKQWPTFDHDAPWHIYGSGGVGLTDDGKNFRYQAEGPYLVFEDDSILIHSSGDRKPDVRDKVSQRILPMVARSEWGNYEFFCPVQGERIPKNAIHNDVFVIHPELKVAVASGHVMLWSQTHVPKANTKVSWHTRNKKREAEWREKLRPLLDLGTTLNSVDLNTGYWGHVLGSLIGGTEPLPLDLTSPAAQRTARTLAWEFTDERLEQECRDQHKADFISIKEK